MHWPETGKEKDRETGLDYYPARYRDADVGYWISPDNARQFPNLYSYSGNFTDPLNSIDRSGRFLAKVRVGFGASSKNNEGEAVNPKNPLGHEILTQISDDGKNTVLHTLDFSPRYAEQYWYSKMFAGIITFAKFAFDNSDSMSEADAAVKSGQYERVNVTKKEEKAIVDLMKLEGINKNPDENKGLYILGVDDCQTMVNEVIDMGKSNAAQSP